MPPGEPPAPAGPVPWRASPRHRPRSFRYGPRQNPSCQPCRRRGRVPQTTCLRPRRNTSPQTLCAQTHIKPFSSARPRTVPDICSCERMATEKKWCQGMRSASQTHYILGAGAANVQGCPEDKKAYKVLSRNHLHDAEPSGAPSRLRSSASLASGISVPLSGAFLGPRPRGASRSGPPVVTRRPRRASSRPTSRGRCIGPVPGAAWRARTDRRTMRLAGTCSLPSGSPGRGRPHRRTPR